MNNKIFLDNKYTKTYLAITSRATGRKLPKETYTENHHIIPKCLYKVSSKTGWLDGSPEFKENKVDLTAHEHLVCHLILRKMLPEHQRGGVTAAAWRLVNIEDENGNRIRVTGRVYARLREEHAREHSKTMSGRSAHNKGKKVTDQTALDNIKKAANDRSKNKKTCEHCGKTMGASAIKQYHGDKCEQNPNKDPNIVTVKTRGKKRTKKQKDNHAKIMTKYYEENTRRGKTEEEKQHLSKVLTGVKKPKKQSKSLSATIQKQLEDGTHNTKIRVSCVKTKKEYSLSTFTRYVINEKPGPRAKKKV